MLCCRVFQNTHARLVHCAFSKPSALPENEKIIFYILQLSFINYPLSLPLKPFEGFFFHQLHINRDTQLRSQPFLDGINQLPLLFHLIKED